MTEDQAKEQVTTWAKHEFTDEGEAVPDVEIINIEHDEDDDSWRAELDVSTSADNPTVTFFVSDIPEHGLQIVSVEY